MSENSENLCISRLRTSTLHLPTARGVDSLLCRYTRVFGVVSRCSIFPDPGCCHINRLRRYLMLCCTIPKKLSLITPFAALFNPRFLSDGALSKIGMMSDKEQEVSRRLFEMLKNRCATMHSRGSASYFRFSVWLDCSL